MSENDSSPSSIIDDFGLEKALTNFIGARSADLLLVPRAGQSGSRLPFNWETAISYYQEFCSGGNECPDDEFPLDCTHFVSHGLSKGEALVNLPETTCAHGVCIRVAELAAAFRNSATKYQNVSRINSFDNTQRGDFCFIVSWFGFSKDHVMVSADRVNSDGGRVWGHTNNRCSELVSWAGQTLVIYRID